MAAVWSRSGPGLETCAPRPHTTYRAAEAAAPLSGASPIQLVRERSLSDPTHNRNRRRRNQAQMHHAVVVNLPQPVPHLGQLVHMPQPQQAHVVNLPQPQQAHLVDLPQPQHGQVIRLPEPVPQRVEVVDLPQPQRGELVNLPRRDERREEPRHSHQRLPSSSVRRDSGSRRVSGYGSIANRDDAPILINDPQRRDRSLEENEPLLDLGGERRRRPQSVTGQNVHDFFTANTPGPITGLSGGTSAVASLLNPPTTNVRPGFANSTYVQRLQPLSTTMTGVGAGASVFTGTMDTLATFTEARQFHKRFGRRDEQGRSGLRRFWDGLVATVKRPFIGRRARRLESSQHAEERSAAKRLLVNTATNVADLGLNQVPTATNSIMSLAGSTAPTVLGPLAAGAGAGISSLVAARSLYRGHRAAKHEGRMESLLGGRNPLQNEEMRAVAEHQRSQMNRRKWRSRLGAAGATLGAVGGGLLLGGLLGASMLTPVGWALAAAGGLAALGLGAYKLYRWNKKRKAGTLGVERNRHAESLHTAANDPNHEGHAEARRILEARGIGLAQVEGDLGLEFLKRKAEAW